MKSPFDSVLVWDAPVRAFHWLLALGFAGAYLSAESERWRLLHVTLGYTVGGLIVFRLGWGLFGTRHARFSDFLRGPAASWRYLRSLLAGTPEPHAGHNPAGGLAIVALLALGATSALSGWALYQEVGGEWLEEVHETLANVMLALVLVHIAAVLLSSRLHHENLVRAMITGRKRAPPQEAIPSARRGLAALLLAAVLAFWWMQWQAGAG